MCTWGLSEQVDATGLCKKWVRLAGNGARNARLSRLCTNGIRLTQTLDWAIAPGMLAKRNSHLAGAIFASTILALPCVGKGDEPSRGIVPLAVNPDYKITTIDLADGKPAKQISFKVGERTVQLPPGTIAVVINPPQKAAAIDKVVAGAAAEPKRLANLEVQTKVDPQLGQMQSQYRVCMEQGRSDDAKRIARWICEDDELAPPGLAAKGSIGQVVPAIPVKEPKPFPLHHQVGYRPLKQDGRGDHIVLKANGDAPAWSSVSANQCSFQFNGASMVDVAKYFQMATGMTIRIELPSSFASVADMQINASVRNKTIEDSLRIALATQGLGYYVRQSELVIVPAGAIAEISKQKKVDASWCGPQSAN